MASRLRDLILLFIILAPNAWAMEPAPEFAGQDLNSGAQISLASYRGKVVLVDFWASWCPPCLESLPAWEQLRNKIGTGTFEVIAINVDEDTDDGIRFLRNRPVSYPVLADPEGEIGKPWGVRSLPRYFLVDREGQIVATYKRFNPGNEARLEQEISTLLKQ